MFGFLKNLFGNKKEPKKDEFHSMEEEQLENLEDDEDDNDDDDDELAEFPNAGHFGYVLRIKLTCPDCNNTIPLNRIKESATCYNCKTKVDLPEDWWREEIFTEANLREALGFSYGEAQVTSVFMAVGVKYELAYGNRFPRCQKCGDGLSEEEHWTFEEIAKTESTHIHCKKCQEPMSIRKPDDFVNAIFDLNVVAILREDEEMLPPSEHKGKVTAFSCLNCHAGLKTDGSARIVECTFCHTDNFLPQELWERLHPVPKPDVWFVVVEFGGDD